MTAVLHHGWCSVKQGASYAVVSERTFRKWLKDGLRFAKLKTGMIRIKYSWIDEYLEKCETKLDQTDVDKIVNEVLDGVLTGNNNKRKF